ncbi:MAG: phage terminase large subunit, partial [Janthinobacterium lividum]
WREDPGAIERIIKTTAERDVALGRKHVKIELPQDPGQAGKAQAQSMIRMLAGHDVRAIPQSGDKVVRSTPFASQAAGGFISILDAEWTDMFLAELTGFPTAGHDDMVDAAASAFNRLTGGTTGLIEYYARMMDDIQEEKDTQAAILVAHGGTMPGLTIKTEETTNMGAAFSTVPKL